MDWGSGVAARLTRLSLDRKGRPLVQLLAADAVRCGLLVDLALAGRLTETAADISIDPNPTGFPPADALLAATAVEPDRSLETWMGERGLTLQQFLDALVDLGRMTEHRALFGRSRYRVTDPRHREQDERARRTASGPVASPADAAVHALGSTGHLIGEHRQQRYAVPPPEVSDQVLDAAGPHTWIVTTGVDFLRARRARYRFGDTVLD